MATRLGIAVSHSRQVIPNGSATASPKRSPNPSRRDAASTNSMRRKNWPSSRPELCWSECTMLAPDSNRKRDTALTIPGRSRQEISSRRIAGLSASGGTAGQYGPMADRTLLPADLERWTRTLLAGSGLREDAAETVSAALVEASRRGVDSHGVARVPIYAQRLRAGLVNGDPRPHVVRQEGAVALMDADQGPGQVAGVMATDLSVELAGSHGVGVVGVRRSTHYGSARHHPMRVPPPRGVGGAAHQ